MVDVGIRCARRRLDRAATARRKAACPGTNLREVVEQGFIDRQRLALTSHGFFECINREGSGRFIDDITKGCDQRVEPTPPNTWLDKTSNRPSPEPFAVFSPTSVGQVHVVIVPENESSPRSESGRYWL